MGGLLFVSFFSWVSFRLLEMDTQPWPLVALGLIILLYLQNGEIPKVLWELLIITSLFCCIVLLEYRADFLTFRSLANYLGIFLAFSGYYLYRIKIGSTLKVIYAVNVCWLISGLIQTFLGPEVLDWLVWVRTSPQRGVTGLAPEATYYGVVLFFLSWLIVLEVRKIRKLSVAFIVINFIFVIFVAKSTTTFLFYISSIPIFLFFGVKTYKGMIGLVGVFCIIVGSSFVIVQSLPQFRIADLIVGLWEDPKAVITADVSVNLRMQHAVLPFYISAIHFGVPQGAHGFSEKRDEVLGPFANLVQAEREVRDKIMSASGTLIFEQGIFVVLLIYFAWRYLGVRTMPRQQRAHLAVWAMLSVSAIPVAFPPLWFVWASLAARRQEQSAHPSAPPNLPLRISDNRLPT